MRTNLLRHSFFRQNFYYKNSFCKESSNRHIWVYEETKPFVTSQLIIIINIILSWCIGFCLFCNSFDFFDAKSAIPFVITTPEKAKMCILINFFFEHKIEIHIFIRMFAVIEIDMYWKSILGSVLLFQHRCIFCSK